MGEGMYNPLQGFYKLLTQARQKPAGNDSRELLRITTLVLGVVFRSMHGEALAPEMADYISILAGWANRKLDYRVLELLLARVNSGQLLLTRTDIERRMLGMLRENLEAALAFDYQWANKRRHTVRQHREKAFGDITRIVIGEAAEVLHQHDPSHEPGYYQKEVIEQILKYFLP